MTLEDSARAYQRAKKAFEDRRAELAADIIKAAGSGLPQADIVRITGYTRERIRQIVNDAAEKERQ